METVKVKIYTFEELPEDIQQKILEKFYDINIFYDWWEYTFEDAKNIGLKINTFELDRGRNITGEFYDNASEVAQNILNNHGEHCQTHITAFNFLEEWQPIFSEYMNEDSELYESEEAERRLIDIENEFLNDLLSDYLSLLDKEWEYITSEEAIKESIIANEYTFRKNGEQFYNY